MLALIAPHIPSLDGIALSLSEAPSHTVGLPVADTEPSHRSAFAGGCSFLRGPGGLWVFLLAFAVFWLVHLSHVALSPPADNVEQMVWMQSLQLGYYKHPPLPTWLMWGVAQVLGATPWATYLLGATLTLGSVGLMASLLRQMGGQRFAWVAVLGMLSITFYNGRLNYYNHNVVLMAWVTLYAWTWWRLLVRPQPMLWVCMGAVAGLGMLSKYQFMVAVICSAELFAASGMWRHRAHWQGALLAMATATLVLSPHLVWLLTTQSPTPFSYALDGSLGAKLSAVQRTQWSCIWTADWLFNRCLPALLLLGVVRLVDRRTPPPPQEAALPHASARLFLWVWGVGPAQVMLGMGLLLGADLQVQWGTAFAAWLVPLVMWELNLRRNALTPLRMKVAVAAFAVIQVALMVQSYHTSALGRRPSSHWRNFPAEAVARDVAPLARELADGQIDIIAGPTAAAGLLSYWMEDHPKVLIDGRLAFSPWLSESDLVEARILKIWPPDTAPDNAIPTLQGWRWKVIPADSPELSTP